MQPQDILKAVFEVITANQQPPAAPAPAAKGVDTSQLLQIVLAALSGKAPDSTVPTTPPVMSPIDKLLGGEALQGKKTPLAILAYAILAIMQTLDPANGPTGTTGSVLTTLIASFGGLGVLAKVDRVVQMLGVIAAKPPAASK